MIDGFIKNKAQMNALSGVLALSAICSSAFAQNANLLSNGTFPASNAQGQSQWGDVGKCTPKTAPEKEPALSGQLEASWRDNSCWQTWGGAISYSMQASGSALNDGGVLVASSTGGANAQIATDFTTSVGKELTATVYIKGNIKQEVTVAVSLGQTFGVQSLTVGPNGWTKFSFKALPPVMGANGKLVENMSLIIHADTPNTTIYISDASVTEQSTAATSFLKPVAVTNKSFGTSAHDPGNGIVGPDIFSNIGTLRIWDLSGTSLGMIFPERSMVLPNAGQVATTPNYGALDAVVDKAQAAGQDILMVLGGNLPGWATDANAHGKCDAYGDANGRVPGSSGPPGNLTAWNAMVQALVNRYGTRIKYWEVWNEPYQCSTFGERRFVGSSPAPNGDYLAYLAQISSSTAAIVHNAGGKVVSPSFTWMRPYFIDQYLSAGGDAAGADFIAVHAYSEYFLPLLTTQMTPSVGPENFLFENHYMGLVRSVMNRYPNSANIPLWDTEHGNYGIFEAAHDGKPDAGALGNDSVVVPYLAREALLKLVTGVDRIVYYSWDNGGCNAALARDSSVTMSPDCGRLAGVNYSLTPLGAAFARMSLWLKGATVSMPVPQWNNPQFDKGKPWTIEVKRPNLPAAYVMWVPSGANYALTALPCNGCSSASVTITKLNGVSVTKSISSANPWALTNQPVLFTPN